MDPALYILERRFNRPSQPNLVINCIIITKMSPRLARCRSLSMTVYVGSELSTGRMDPRIGSGRIGVKILQEFGGSGQHFGFFSFLLIISWCIDRYESSNTTFGLIDLL